MRNWPEKKKQNKTNKQTNPSAEESLDGEKNYTHERQEENHQIDTQVEKRCRPPEDKKATEKKEPLEETLVESKMQKTTGK